MAIGVRISSINLNGDTTNVVFLPSTGGTINLGTQTIPFNNLTTFPYGLYEIYVPQYDYTYTIEVTENYEQTYSVISTLSGDTTIYCSGVLNFESFTAQVIDFNLPTSTYQFSNVYPITEKGYTLAFYNNQTEGFKFLFCNSNMNIINSIDVNSFNFYDLDGIYCVVIDDIRGIFYYFDGETLNTFNWDSTQFPSYSFPHSWDYVSLFKTFVFKIYNSDGIEKYYLLGNGEQSLIIENDINNNSITSQFYRDGSFYTFIIYNSDGSLSELSIRSALDNSVINTILLNDFIYNDYTTSFFSKNQYTSVFWNNTDSSVDYYIVNFDGNTLTTSQYTHERLNYPNIVSFSSTNFYLNNVDSDSLFLIFYNGTEQSNIVGTLVSYCDILYRYSGNTEMSSYTFQDSGVEDKNIYLYPNCGKNFYTYCGIGDGSVSSLSITDSGGIILPVSSFTEIYGNTDGYWFGNKFIIQNFISETFDVLKLSLIDNTGAIADTLTLTLGGGYQYNYFNRYGIFIINNGFDTQFYVNELTSGFTQMDYYDIISGSNFYWDGNNYNTPSQTINLNSGTGQIQILTKNNFGPQFNLPTNNGGYYIGIGKSRVLYVYGDNSDDFIHIELYDFNFNLKSHVKTTYYSTWQISVVKDRYSVVFDTGTYYDIFLISDNQVQNTLTSNNYFNSIVNDYIYWND